MAADCHDAVMLFGDSLTQRSWEYNGIGARLANIYARRFDVLNRGYSGFTTEWALPVFEQIFAKKAEQPHVPPVRLLTIWFGTNDACIKPSPQHVPLDRFVANLRAMIHLVTSPSSAPYSPRTKVVLLTPPPVNTVARGADLASRDPPRELDRSFDVTQAYADAVRVLGTSEGVLVVDVWTKLWEAVGKEESKLSAVLTDGLHLNEKGYKIVFDALKETIDTQVPELAVVHDKSKYVFPQWEYFLDHTVEDLKAQTWVGRDRTQS